MRSALPTLSLVPDFDVTVHLVLDDFGKIGRAYREVDEEKGDRATLISRSQPESAWARTRSPLTALRRPTP